MVAESVPPSIDKPAATTVDTNSADGASIKSNQKLAVNKAVKSAEGVAALRAASAKATDSAVRNPDYLARDFVGNYHRLLLMLPHPLLRRVVEAKVPGGYCYFLARTHFFDEALVQSLQDGAKQIVILGAGYDTRALRFTSQLDGITVFEVDLPATQQRKLTVIKSHEHKVQNNIVYIEHDFLSPSLMEKLQQYGFDSEKKSLFMLEGVSYYLKETDVRQLLNLCSVTADGSQFVLDYSDQSFVDGDLSSYGSAKMASWLRRNNEPFKFGLSKGSESSFFAESGLCLRRHYDAEGVAREYLFDSKQRSIGKPLGYLNLATCIKD